MTTQFPWDERGLVTLTSTGASTANNSTNAAGTDLDCRTAGSENAKGDITAAFLLICQWATPSGIVGGTIAADLYLVPKVDGTNLPQIDTTGGGAYISALHRAGAFVAAKEPTADTDTYFAVPSVDLQPLLYTAYILNRSGQTISANWSLKVVTAQFQGV